MDTVDTVGTFAHRIPVEYWKSRLVLGYTTGPGDTIWTPEERALFPHWAGIDQSDSAAPESRIARVGDVEAGAMKIAVFVQWCRNRHLQGAASTGYLSESLLVAARLAIKDAGIPGVTYGVANWNLNRQQALARLGGDVVWVQYASPTSNPNTILPGSDMTLHEANCDLGVAVDGWPNFHPNPPAPKTENLPRATVTFDPDDGHWTVTGIPFGKE